MESGAQRSESLVESESESFFVVVPRSFEIQTSSRPLRSETYAIHLPSGDQAGSRSRQDVSVTRCASPLSVAMVKISPWLAIAARLVDGERWKVSASWIFNASTIFSLVSETMLILYSMLQVFTKIYLTVSSR